jgi:hypothetical protein
VSEKRQPTDKEWADAAFRLYDSSDIDFDTDAKVSVADDGDYAWVQAWVRVHRDEAVSS